jgi:hypothetical protein
LRIDGWGIDFESFFFDENAFFLLYGGGEAEEKKTELKILRIHKIRVY